MPNCKSLRETRERGANLRVWNADRQNETHSLSVFHPDALRLPSDDPDDKGTWLEESFDAQVRERFDSLLDLAGGDPLVRLLARETELVATLEQHRVRLVLWQVLGPDVADLDYLKLSNGSRALRARYASGAQRRIGAVEAFD
jgi:hypothetical protein